MSNNPVTGEVSNSKVAGVFPNRGNARSAADEMIAELSLQPAQVKLIGPDTADVDIKLQPEGGGIQRTLVVAHVKMGIVGAAMGLLAFGILHGMDVTFVVSSPVAAGLCAFAFGAVGGLLLGGLVSLRPDQSAYINATRDAISEGRTTVVVHALSSEQRTLAASFLTTHGAEVTQSL
jgi:VIT1/CCC1 family predicted Fe2+/Mn2+ transporter